MWGLPQKQNARRADKIRLCGHLRRYKKIVKKTYIIYFEIPYENAKEMLLVEEVDNKDFLTGLFDVMYDELPTPKPKKKK